MTEPILVVDIGTATSAAAIVAQQRTALLRDPYTGADGWPSAVLADDAGWLAGTPAERRKRAAPSRYIDAPRRALDARAPLLLGQREVTGEEAMTVYLSALATEARQVYGSPLRRLVLTVPARYPTHDDRRDRLIGIGEAAGFAEVELLDEAVAVALDPQTGADLPDGALVLVVDLGVTWTLALVRLHPMLPAQLAQRSAATGLDLDTGLLAELRAQGRTWVEPLLAAPGDAGLRAHHEALEFVRRLKHRLTEVDVVQAHLTPVTPAYRLSRAWLEAFLTPAVSALVTGVRTIVGAAGVNSADIAAVVLAGGAARMPIVGHALAESLGHPLRRSAAPEFAVIRGAARWASRTSRRTIRATAPGWRSEAVVWDLPPAPVRLLHWTVEEDVPYPPGAVVAEIRTADDLVLTLTASSAGSLVGPRPARGTPLGSVLAVAARRPLAALTQDPPPLVRSVQTNGSYLLSLDRQVLLECDATGTSVRSTVPASGELLDVFTPEPPVPPVGGGRVFIDPDGHAALVSWDTESGVSVWDIASGKLTVRIDDAVGGRRFLVDEIGWRLAVEGAGRAAVGRYRRSTITMWDLRTGALLAKTTEASWGQRHPRFNARSGTDGLTPIAESAGLRAAGGAAGLLLLDTATGTELFRTPAPDGAPGRVAFDGDGRHLLVVWEGDGWSRIDVHEI